MALHDHKPDGPRRVPTPWFCFIDWVGLLCVLGAHLAMGAAESVMIMFFARRSWAFDPVPWIYGPPLDVPLRGDRFVSYDYMLVWSLVLVIGGWGACVSLPTWPGRWQAVLAVAGVLLLVPHAVVVCSLF